MPDFRYIARELSGSQVSGVLTASSEHDALTLLAAQSLFPVRIESTQPAEGRVSGRRRVGARHLATFYTQLADLLRSGVPLLKSLEILERQATQPVLRQVIQDVREHVADGARLAEAFERHPKVFGALVASMVRAGEEGSFLEDVLKRVAAFTEHQQDLKSRVVGAMVYPVFLVVMGTIVVTAMLVFFVPKFAPIFQRMQERDQLPWATTTLIAVSQALGQHGWLLLLGLGAAVVFAIRYFGTDEGRLRFDRLRLSGWKLGPIGRFGPVTIGAGPIVRDLAIARFCRILGTLLKNGVPILRSLHIAREAAGNHVLSEAIGAAAESVSAGESLAEPLASCRQFPDDILEMIAVGEEANNLEQVLIDIADNLERRTNRQLELFVRMLEPVMLLLLAGIILFVVVALLLPILQSSGAF